MILFRFLDILDIFCKMVDIHDIFITCGKQRNHNVPIYGKYVFLFFQLQQESHPSICKKWQPGRYKETAADSNQDTWHSVIRLLDRDGKYSGNIWKIDIVRHQNQNYCAKNCINVVIIDVWTCACAALRLAANLN